jgi:hypothetical protein
MKIKLKKELDKLTKKEAIEATNYLGIKWLLKLSDL